MPRMNRVCRNNTSVANKNGNTCITLHSTVVVEFDHEMIILRHGGYRSYTTKARMNQASNEYGLGYQVFQNDHEWFVSYKGHTFPFDGAEYLLIR